MANRRQEILFDPDLRYMDVSILHRHQPATILGTERIFDLNYHL